MEALAISQFSRQLDMQETGSPIGPLTIAATERGVCLLSFGPMQDNLAEAAAWADKHLGEGMYRLTNGQGGAAREACGQLAEYFSGRLKSFSLPLDLRGTPFQMAVWQALTAIPYGEVRSYLDIARTVGRPKAVRAVGGANHNNPVAIVVPCHRVIGKNGAMVGYGGGLPIKERLLQLEGVLQI